MLKDRPPLKTMASDRLAARYEQEMVKVFRRHWATSAPAARRLRDLGIKDNAILQGLLATAVLRRAGPERYFLHESTWAARSQMSWGATGRLAILLVVLVIAVAIILMRLGS